MLEEIRKNYIKEAKTVIPNYQQLDVNKLCNLYVENEKDDIKRSGYFAAIILKKWGYIGRHYTESKASNFSIEDCYDMILEAVCYVLKSRSWKNPDKAIYKDPQGPDKCLNRAIWSVRKRYYYLSNMDKRKINFGKWSLDSIQETVNDHLSSLDTNNTLNDDELSFEESVNIDLFISHLLENNKVLEGLIIDNICYDDCFVRNKNEFKLFKLVNNLFDYNINTIKRICLKYNVNESKLIDVLPILNENKSNLLKIVKATIKEISTNEELKKDLCY